MAKGKSINVSLALIAFMMLATNANAQLGFEPNIAGGVLQFDPTVTGEVSSEEVTFIGQQQNDAPYTVEIRINGQYFAAEPNNFRIDPQQRVAVTFRFNPEAEGQFEAGVTILNYLANGDRPRVYNVTLQGEGIEDRAPEIVVAPAAVQLLVEEAGGRAERSLTVRNTGGAELSWNIPAYNAAWLTAAPRNGRIAAGGAAQIRLSTSELPEENGNYEVTVRILSNDPDRGEVRIPVTLTVEINRDVTQTIHLRRGWNLISLNVVPNDDYRVDGRLDLPRLISQIVNSVVIIKNFAGQFCIPSRDFFNNMDEWDLRQGYWINVNQDVDWEIVGDIIPADRQIDLNAGWQTVAYYPNQELSFGTAFANLINQGAVTILKNGRGEFMIPDRNFGFDRVAIPGDGFQLKLSRNASFHYPAE